MNKKLIVLFCSVFSLVIGFSSETKGYQIKIEVKDATFNQLYLLGYYGGESFILDSSYSKKGTFVFSKKDQVEEGIYSLISNTQIYLFDIMISASRKLEIVTQQTNPLQYQKITKNNENIVFFEYQKAVIYQEDISPFIDTSPDTFLSNYVRAKHIPDFNIHFDDILSGFDTLTFDHINQLILDHHFDQIHLQDPRLLRTPLKLDVEYYFVSLFDSMSPEEVDCVQYIDLFFSRTIDTNSRPIDLETQFFYLKKVMQLYLYNNPKFDPIFVYLYDQYYHPEQDQWNIFSDSDQRIFSNIVERKRRTLPGHEILPVEAFDLQKSKVSSSELSCDYIILWFWDPDCEHCLHETPVLYDFYKRYHTQYNFEVIAISVTDDYDRWVKFIQTNQMDWINLSYAMGDPNYDFIDYFDLLATPGIFVIDKKHEIKARQFPLTKLEQIFENLKK